MFENGASRPRSDSGDAGSSSVPRGHVRSGSVRSGSVRSGSVRSGSVRSGSVRSGDTTIASTAPADCVLLERVASMGDDELVDESVRIAASLSSAQAELAAVLAEIERRGVHGQWDCPSIERFAGWKCQIAPARAASLGMLGRALTELPTLGRAIVSGELAADKAVAIARVASPASEAALVDLARHATVDQTRRICAAWRRYDPETPEPADSADAAEARRRDEASIGRVIVIHDDDGVELRARFDHVDGALVLSALDAITAAVRRERAEAVPADAPSFRSVARPGSVDEVPLERLGREQWRAQGLRRAFEIAVAAPPVTTARNGFRTEVVVHVPVDLLLDPSDVDDPGIAGTTRMTVAAGPSGAPTRDPSIPALEPRGIRLRRDAARQLVCDAGLHTVLEDDTGDPLHMGRRRATISDALRRAVHARHPHCTWPGCTATIVHLHHRHHRVAGGHDDVENLVPLCAHHHGVVHRRSILIGREPDGTLRFVRVDGTRITGDHPFARTGTTDSEGHDDRIATTDTAIGTTTRRSRSAVDVLQERQRALGIDVDSPLRASQWLNDPFDLGEAIAAVADRRDAALRRTEPTGRSRDAP